MRDCLEEVKAQNIDITQYRIIGGGAKGKLWRQILCDILATPLTCTIDNDSSLGSAMLAGVAVGMFGSFEESVEMRLPRSLKTCGYMTMASGSIAR